MRISDWSSDVCSSDLVISVDTTGLATGGTTAGTSTITASKDGKTAMLTLTGEGRVLRTIVVTGTNPTTGAPSNATAPGGSVKYTAQGVYSGESTPEDINGAIINWTIDDTSLGTPSATRSEEHTSELQSLMRNSY